MPTAVFRFELSSIALSTYAPGAFAKMSLTNGPIFLIRRASTASPRNGPWRCSAVCVREFTLCLDKILWTSFILVYTVHHPICGHPICGQNPICGRIFRARKIHKSGTWRISENKMQNLFLNKIIHS